MDSEQSYLVKRRDLQNSLVRTDCNMFDSRCAQVCPKRGHMSLAVTRKPINRGRLPVGLEADRNAIPGLNVHAILTKNLGTICLHL